MPETPSMLALAVIQPEDAGGLLDALAVAGHGATYLTARGGFLNRHAVAVLVLAPADRRASVVAAIRATCSRRTTLVTPVAEAEFGYVPEPIEVEVGGAVVFGLPVSSVVPFGPRRAATPTPIARRVSPGAPLMPEAAKEESAMDDTEPTKLLVAIVPDRAADRVVAALIDRHFGATTVGSTGGFLRRGNTTILTGVPAEHADSAADLIRAACRGDNRDEPREGGIVFALDVDWRLRV